ncbi:MAG TPA: hypothetical protein PLB36_06565, partial [Bacillota bacterium]|nr:hypothetical protein [Bacillota bacterium]HOL12525.1 hypothetical protein [Bacillota bacterium]HPP61434.1 hypothetical protein [Bacillota bacterium]HPZ78865.1 hypothetical protein [Bacillota bacterium]HQD74996.1 hypothetical protein [Bacillota bacterium]
RCSHTSCDRTMIFHHETKRERFLEHKRIEGDGSFCFIIHQRVPENLVERMFSNLYTGITMVAQDYKH